ncbi:RNA polymerase sigma factor [Mucilaginibacter sp. SP1R1]|uniref:RNA polymerase sigma factor n=1 Tax=Mucilaginibacter sp. SP1R1 TaxID=2723091 RepID=UPI001616A51F|nr:sigma-70 family RNA polymerase sigma factor [Mucilaginibacter sp. SP1R1]MBB6150630.1 RNA polymerase sigma-70 factor (ECF subfamily) [Mucilaginibacter sp. SP1R1]
MNLFAKQDERLVKGCKLNDRQAQEGLYKLFYAEMLRLCYRYLKSDDLAMEALNAGFLKVFQNISAFEPKKGELGAWIRTIMVRTCIDLGRKEAKFNEIGEGRDDSEAIFITPEALDKLFAADLLKAVRTLPAATQLVFNLSVIEGYSHKEIGEQLLISESTSRWHLSEAKKQLRAMLDQPYKSVIEPTENKNKKA